jgi:hypothetical protein
MADKPICCPKSQDAGCSYRFAYSFNDTPPVEDANGAMLPTSLCTYDRTSYSFMGTWGKILIDAYKNWQIKTGEINSVTYALKKDDTFPSGTTIELNNISLTFGETGGPDFQAAIEDPYSMKKKAVRGGSWKDPVRYIQGATRTYEYQNESHSYIGFRCVRSYAGSDRRK